MEALRRDLQAGNTLRIIADDESKCNCNRPPSEPFTTNSAASISFWVVVMALTTSSGNRVGRPVLAIK